SRRQAMCPRRPSSPPDWAASAPGAILPAPSSMDVNSWTLERAEATFRFACCSWEEVAVPAKKRRSPEEKKRHSYSRDRRNTYGGDEKSSRKKKPRKKEGRHHTGTRRAGAVR